MADKYHGYATRRYGATQDGHDVELEFDKKLVVLNRAKLRIDGDVVDSANVFYGEKDLRTTLPGGDEVVVTIDSGMAGELRRAQLRAPDGSWIDMQERQPRS